MSIPKKPKRKPLAKGALTTNPRAVISAPIVNRDPHHLNTR